MISNSMQKDKKNQSLSFTESHIDKDNDKKHYRQFRSHSQKTSQDQEQSIQQKVKLSNVLTQKIQQHNQQNSSKHKPYQWQLAKIEQKRIISGLKSKLKCKLIPSELYLLIRVSFTQDFFKSGQKLQEGTIFVELEQLNFQITNQQKRAFQIQIEKTLKQVCSKAIFAQNQEEHKWVKDLLAGIEVTVQGKEYHKRVKKGSEAVNRKEVSTKYILYHAPVCLTWSPKGQFCLTENKAPATKLSLIGAPLSFKQSIQVPRVSLKTVIQQQLSQQIPQPQQLSIFNWNMTQELELFALTNHHKREISSYYKDNSKKDFESRKKLASNTTLTNNNPASNNNSNTVKNDYVILEYGWKKLSLNIRKIYQRYFAPRPDFQYDLTRGEKLNVYFVLSENRRYEDEMLYLMEKINSDKLKPPLQVILSTTLSSYPTLLSSHKTLDPTRYFIIAELLKEQRLKSNSSQINLSLCLKSIIVQNEYHALQIQTYFNNCFKLLKVNNAPSKYNIYYIGSYLHFDQYRAQKILVKLLEQYEYNYEMNLKNQKEAKFILQSKHFQRIKKQVKVKRIVKFPPVKDDWLLTEEQRKKFVETILPVLLVRDVNFQEFYYRQIQRIITTNQKIVKFFKHLYNLIKKVQQERHEFIKYLINEYSSYEQQKKIKNETHDVRRLFTVYCQMCQRPNKTFQIAATQKLRICPRCEEQTYKKA